MRRAWLLTGAILVAAGLCLSPARATQLPPQAVVYLDNLARFRDKPVSVRVLFYQVRGKSVGVVILGLDGQEIARATENLTLGLYEGTGVYDVTGDGWPELVMIGVAGAKTLGATIYKYHDGRLEEIHRTSGFTVKIVNLRGQPVVARNFQYGSISDLYVWKDGKFVESNDQFPEFYGSEIEEQKWIIGHPGGFPVNVIAQACELGARALVYGKNYEEAEKLCERALKVVRSSLRVTANQIGAPPEVIAAEREQTQEEIRQVLVRIAKAKEQALPRLPP